MWLFFPLPLFLSLSYLSFFPLPLFLSPSPFSRSLAYSPHKDGRRIGQFGESLKHVTKYPGKMLAKEIGVKLRHVE